MKPLTALLSLLLLHSASSAASAENIDELRVLVLSTMLADRGIGEWGFAALIEADEHRILFDTGARPETVLQNAKEIGVDLSDIEEVVLSHNHWDHTTGLVALRRSLSTSNPDAMSRTHVGEGVLWERPRYSRKVDFRVKAKAYEELGGRIVEHAKPAEIHPGIWVTGPVPRVHPERNWSPTGNVRSPQGLIEDTIPESQSLVIETDEGLVVISGCGHAGIINTLEYARKAIRDAPVHAALGGFHLLAGSNDHLDWTGQKMRELGVGHFMGAHCTGIEAVFRLRESAGLDRSRAVVGAVGASFTLGEGIEPLSVAR